MKNNYFMHGTDAFGPNEKIGIYSCDADTEKHVHDFVELVYFKSGVGIHNINGETYEISNNSICIMNTGVEHFYHVSSHNMAAISVINCIFYPEFFGKEFSSDNFIEEIYKKLFVDLPPIQNKLSFIQIKSDMHREIASLFNILSREFNEKKTGYLDVIKHTVITIIIKIFREYIQKPTKHSLSLTNATRIERSLEYINANLSQKLSLKNLANKFGFCSVYYNKLFYEYTGLTFNKYLQKARCELACKLLISTDDSIQDICEKVGYFDPKHFYVLFKKHIGLAPNSYRKKQTSK